MISGISTFTNLPTPVKVGLLVVSGGGIVAAIRYLPRNILLVIFIGLAVVALLVLLYWRLLKWLKKRRAAPMERGLMENTSATPQGVSKPADVARLDDLRKKFEDGSKKFHAAGKSLYAFPWYMIVGEPGSGKTEAIRHCNVGFPPGLQDELQGTGGTLNMNWWFTDYAVILDTAGRLMFEEVETGGSSEWKEFLNLLKKYRTRCPINGVLLVIPTDSLIKDTADEIEQKASKIARQFDVIQRALDVRFPVFVVITKSDLLNGFRDFFDNLDDPQLQHQILGWSNPAPLDEPYNPDFINQHLEAIRGRLFRRRLALMQEVISDEPGVEGMRSVDTLYAFPQSLTKIAPRMARYLELIFSVGSQWSCKPLFFRGIYFTSSMREGSALDEDLAESLGVPVDSLPDGRVWERDRAYFLRDLFMKKVFREQGLVTYATNAKKLHSRRKAAVLISAAASMILLLFFTIRGWVLFRDSIGEMKDYLWAPAALIGDSGKLKELQNELQVIERIGEDKYKYIGGTPIKIHEILDGVKRFEFFARLANIVSQWEKKGVHWIFKPVERIAKRIEPKKLHRAQKVLYESSVLQPFLNAASDIMNTQENGRWTRQDPDPNALRQLVRFKTNMPLNEEGEYKYSAGTFLDPLFEYVVRHSCKTEEELKKVKTVKKMYVEHRDVLHRPLGEFYGKDWPPESLRTDPNYLRPAIEQGVELFNEYWDPNQLRAHSQDYGQAMTIENLKNALEKFYDAEKRILSLRDDFDPCDWDEGFIRLNEARETVNNYARTLEDANSLRALWLTGANNIIEDVNKNYDFLLNELDPNKVKTGPFLDDIRGRLEKARGKIINKLRKREFEEKLKQLDDEFWTQRDSRRLYEIRFEMYSTANKQLGAVPHISELNDVPGAIREVEKTVEEARRKIDELLKLGRGAFHVKDANDVSTSALDFAERNQLYYIVNGGLNVAHESIADLKKLIEEGAKWDYWAVIPEKAVRKEYDPENAADIVGGWKLLGGALERYDLADEMRLRKIYEDKNRVYTEYTKDYMQYWLESAPDRWIENEIPRENNWKAQHNELEKLDFLDVFRELRKFGKTIKEGALDKFANYTLDHHKKVKQFRDSIEKLSDTTFQMKCERMLKNWGRLSDDVFQARKMFLESRPRPLVRDYFFSATASSPNSPAEFVDTYWTKLAYTSLDVLTDEIQREGKRAADQLITEYGRRFPLARDGQQDLDPAELEKVGSLLRQVVSWEEYVEGTIGAGEETEVDKVDMRLKPLLKPSVSEYQVRLAAAIKQVFQGLPEGGNTYYCKIIILSRKEQRKLLREGEVFLPDQRTLCELVQGDEKSGDVRIRALEKDKLLGIVKYPHDEPIQLVFSESGGRKAVPLEFPKPWACLRMLHECSEPDKGKGYIKLNKKELPGVLWLKLEFCKEPDGAGTISFPKINEWPSLKK